MEKETKSIKDKVISDIRNIFEQGGDHCKTIRNGNFYSNNYEENESNGDRESNLSIEEYFIKVKPYLKDIIIDLQKSDAWDIQLTIALSLISSKDTIEERRMHSKIDNIEYSHG